ncbi:MAG: chorismate lyase [Pseudomonadota bacterium]
MILPSTSREPVWHTLFTGPQFVIPKLIHPWLTDMGSLTQALINSSRHDFQVRVHYQGWQAATASERDLLQIPARQRTLVRLVRLYTQQRPAVFARTVIPQRSLVGRTRGLRQLGQQPLGAALFADSSTRRSLCQFACFKPRHLLYQQACRTLNIAPASIWGRRTVYRYAGQHLLVNELFLPDLPDYPTCRNHLAGTNGCQATGN